MSQRACFGSALGVNAMTVVYVAIFLLLFAVISTVQHFRRRSRRKRSADMLPVGLYSKKTAA